MLGSGKAFARGRRLAKRSGDVQQANLSFPGLWLTGRTAKSRWISAASADVRNRPGLRGASEPFGAAPGRSTVPVIAISAVAAVAVKVAVHAHFALAPVMAPAFPAPEPVHTGQNGEPALLAVIERLVERVGSFRDLLHGPSRRGHILGPVTQPRHRIIRLLLAGIVPRRVHPRVGAIDSELGELPDRGLDRRPQLFLVGGQFEAGMDRRDP